MDLFLCGQNCTIIILGYDSVTIINVKMTKAKLLSSIVIINIFVLKQCIEGSALFIKASEPLYYVDYACNS